MTYKVFYSPKAAKELAQISKPFQQLIVRKITQLSENFASLSNNLKILKGKHDYYRLRVGGYRVIFHKDDERILITIIRIGDRKNIYDSL